jgi:hypothetical protein
MAILVMRETGTPGDNGIFDGDSRATAYREAVASGKTLSVPNGTRAVKTYETPPSAETTAVYSVVKIVDGPHAGRAVIVQDRYLK